MSGFRRGPIQVKVVRRKNDPSGLVKVTCGADPETDGYRVAYRGTLEQACACLEACYKRLFELRQAGGELEITPEDRP